MRDEIDGRTWTDNHEQFSASLDAGLAAIAAGIRRLAPTREVPKQLLAAAGAFGMTLIALSTVA